METLAPPSLLPPQSPNANYGFFGYKARMCDLAIERDNAPMLAECLERDFFDPDAEMLSFKTIRQYCREVAPACFEMLQEKAPQKA